MQATFDALSKIGQQEQEAREDAAKIVPEATDTEAIIAQLKSLGDAITNLSKRVDTLTPAPAAGAPSNKDLMDEYDADNGKFPEKPGESEEKE